MQIESSVLVWMRDTPTRFYNAVKMIISRSIAEIQGYGFNEPINCKINVLN